MSTLQRRFKRWVNSEVEKNLDKERFSSLPLKMRIGIFILAISFSVGYGVPLVLLWTSRGKNQISNGVAKGTLVYSASWLLGVVGLSLAGKDSIKYPIYFFAKFLKQLFPVFFRSDQ